MSSLIVPVTKIDELRPHPNADALEIAVVGGWQVVVQKGSFQSGSEVVYFPPDTVLPTDVSDDLGVTKYLSNGRVRQVKLRGEPSFGFVTASSVLHKYVPLGDHASLARDAEAGLQNVAAYFGATKYEPPVRPVAGDMEPEHPLFQRYTEIENFRHFPDLIRPGEQVVVTEKIHGTNARVGVVEGRIVAGSKETQRKRPEHFDVGVIGASIYWHPFAYEGVRMLIAALHENDAQQTILFGEVYGKVQSLHYDAGNALGFRAFDYFALGRYVDYSIFDSLMSQYEIPAVPVLYRGPFDLDIVKTLAEQDSTLAPGQMREGVVIRPTSERFDPAVGRVILKYISERYLFSKGVTDFKDV
jgi:RNA ligase (TIGR02306 family)